MLTTGIIADGRLFPVRLSCRASNKALAMLSEMSPSMGVNSPSSSSGLGGHEMTPSSPGRGDALVVFTGWVVCPVVFPRIDFSFAFFSGIMEGMRSFSSNTEN